MKTKLYEDLERLRIERKIPSLSEPQKELVLDYTMAIIQELMLPLRLSVLEFEAILPKSYFELIAWKKNNIVLQKYLEYYNKHE